MGVGLIDCYPVTTVCGEKTGNRVPSLTKALTNQDH